MKETKFSAKELRQVYVEIYCTAPDTDGWMSGEQCDEEKNMIKVSDIDWKTRKPRTIASKFWCNWDNSWGGTD